MLKKKTGSFNTRMKILVVLVVLVCIVFMIVTCAMAATEEKLLIGNILSTVQIEWFGEVIMGMEQAARDFNVKLYTGFTDFDVSKEGDLMDQMIAQKVKGIALCPANIEGSVAAFERVYDAGIPIVIYDLMINTNKVKYFVGIDNVELGRIAGEYIVNYVKEKMGGKAKLAILVDEESSSTRDRLKGFNEKIKALPGIEVVAKQKGGTGSRQDSLPVMESILQAQPDLELVWAANQGNTLGALDAIKGANKQDSIKLIGIDMSIDLAKEMLESKTPIVAIITQQPMEIGYKTIENLVKLNKGEAVDSKTLFPLATYESDKKDECQKYLDERQDLIKR